MLVEHGFRVRVARSPHWEEPVENYGLAGVELVQVTHAPDPFATEGFDERVDCMYAELESALHDIDVVLTHDMI